MESYDIELSVVMPCLNEAATLATCIGKAQQWCAENGVRAEVVVADNGSSDGSPQIAQQCGARVVKVEKKGYGAALMGGIHAARGRYVIMGDADDSYDFSSLDAFMEALRAGADLVMGNRFKGGIRPGAMPALHRYLGNPVLSAIGRIFFRSCCRDFHCGLRGFRRDRILGLNLCTSGMEFASEMVIKATLNGCIVREVPTTLAPDGRNRPPHLRSFRDGWRHLRFMLLFSPRWLFFIPGLVLMVLGLVSGLVLMMGPVTVGPITFDAQTLLLSATAVVVGCQAVQFDIFARLFATRVGLLPVHPRLRPLETMGLEAMLLMSTLLILAGLAGTVHAVVFWGTSSSFGSLEPAMTLRILIPSMAAIMVGFQSFFGSFFLSVLHLERTPSPRG